jgi:hypothetical protein
MRDTNKIDRTLAQVCFESCEKIVGQIQKAKNAILTQFRDLKADHEQALRLALNEAEGLAWQTPYPHLVFADLAEEKALALARWSDHQRAILGE